ncbi:hypothetical protein ACK31A_07215 [Aeromonas caviae]
MKYEEMLKNIGHQIAMALNENDDEKRSEHKYNLLEQLEYLIEFSKGRDRIVLTTAAFIDQCTNGECQELTTALRDSVFKMEISQQ